MKAYSELETKVTYQLVNRPGFCFKGVKIQRRT